MAAVHNTIRADVNRSGTHVLLYLEDGRPYVWAEDGTLYENDGHRVSEPCKVWRLVDHAERMGLRLADDADVLGLLRAAGADCDEENGEQCGCGLVYGATVYYRGEA